jgi:hypothetical protein
VNFFKAQPATIENVKAALLTYRNASPDCKEPEKIKIHLQELEEKENAKKVK